MRTPSSVILLLPITLAAACGARSGGDADWAAGACLEHGDCSDGQLCVLGTCGNADPDTPLDVSEILASQWFADPDGACAYDDECGPWSCSGSTCVTPAEAGRELPAMASLRYWDGSCYTDADCGPWICSRRWCTDAAFSSPVGSTGPEWSYDDEWGFDSAWGGGVPCLDDSECPDDSDCVYPGECVAGVGYEPMTFGELDNPDWYANPDGSCVSDTECGPVACIAGWCTPQEYAGRPTQTRSDFFYYDASCSNDAQCGAWVCASGFCNDPVYP